MVNRVVLNNVDHADFRVITRRSAEFGDNINQALIFPTEFLEIQREYPILFRRGDDQQYCSVALLGLDRDENLFLDGDGGWQCRYVPAVQERGPFSIGVMREANQGPASNPADARIQIDIDDPRVNRETGEPLFLPHGGNAPYLEYMIGVLQRIHVGLEATPRMFAAFEKAALVEPATIEINLSEREQVALPDLFAISAERLARLDGGVLEELNHAGFLDKAVQAAASLGNVQRLIELKSRKSRSS